jgi:hypothetical protein
MNLEELIEEGIRIYGSTCIFCKKNKVNALLNIVPHNCLRQLRRINKRKTRKNYRELSVFSSWNIENLLVACHPCRDKIQNKGVYQSLNITVLAKLDEIRLSHGFLPLLSVANQRDFRFKLYNKIIEK